MSGKSKSLPRHAIVLRRYTDLETHARAFAEGHLKSLVLIGPPGVGKSFTFRSVLGDHVCWMGGNASPFGIYLNAYLHVNQPLVLNDIDDLYRNSQGVRLLKALCQTDPVRTLSWQTRARDLDKLRVPREFQTTSPIALIANDWQTLSPNVAAIEDRVHLLAFQPTPLEIHQHCSKWFWDQEIFDFVTCHLPLLETHSLRLYVRACELKAAGLDWHSTIHAQCFEGTVRIVAQLRADRSYQSEEERVRAFVAGGHGCRATYFNHVKRLPSPMEIPKIELVTKLSPQVLAESMDLIEVLRRRFRDLGHG